MEPSTKKAKTQLIFLEILRNTSLNWIEIVQEVGIPIIDNQMFEKFSENIS